jgi:hypothetical protein
MGARHRARPVTRLGRSVCPAFIEEKRTHAAQNPSKKGVAAPITRSGTVTRKLTGSVIPTNAVWTEARDLRRHTPRLGSRRSLPAAGEEQCGQLRADLIRWRAPDDAARGTSSAALARPWGGMLP